MYTPAKVILLGWKAQSGQLFPKMNIDILNDEDISGGII